MSLMKGLMQFDLKLVRFFPNNPDIHIAAIKKRTSKTFEVQKEIPKKIFFLIL